MSGFAKIYASLWDGSLADNWHVWSLFVFILAHTSADGIFSMTPEAISRRSCMPLDMVKDALSKLESQDARSRNKDSDGRRIVKLEDDDACCQWRVVNHGQYRERRDIELRRQQTREAMRRHRANVSHSEPSVSQDVSSSEQGEPIQKQKQIQIQRQIESESLADRDATGGTLLLGMGTDQDQQQLSHTAQAVASTGGMVMPVLGGQSWAPTDAQLEAWRSAFPAANVEQELAKMTAWLLSNPTNMKTARGMARFVNSWLSRVQNKAIPRTFAGTSRRTGADARYKATNQL